jgi:hypothetical protein
MMWAGFGYKHSINALGVDSNYTLTSTFKYRCIRWLNITETALTPTATPVAAYGWNWIYFPDLGKIDLAKSAVMINGAYRSIYGYTDLNLL